MIEEIFGYFRPLYYRDANGAILVFDITDEDSFDRVGAVYKEINDFEVHS